MTAERDRAWVALGDPTRVAIIDDLLSTGAASASELARRQPVTRQAVVKHLETLERAGLVRRRPRGREVLFEVEAAALGHARRQILAITEGWDHRLRNLKDLAEGVEG